MKPRFPKRPEFLFVDPLNNLREHAEDQAEVLARAEVKKASLTGSVCNVPLEATERSQPRSACCVGLIFRFLHDHNDMQQMSS